MSAVQQLMLAQGASGPVAGQAVITASGTWTVPAGVTSISVVAVGQGGGGRVQDETNVGGGGGGALAYRNNLTVVPGTTYTITINGVSSAFGDGICTAGAGYIAGGLVIHGTGGKGGDAPPAETGTYRVTAGGGAGGYSGPGGDAGGTTPGGAGNAGLGGGGGGGYSQSAVATGGGGVGLLGQGSNGAAGTSISDAGKGGSGGGNGFAAIGGPTSGNGGSYGGGGGSGQLSTGGPGAVRIIWPGDVRSFPSTRTADE